MRDFTLKHNLLVVLEEKVHPLVNVNPIQSLLSSVLNLVNVKNYPNYRCSFLTLDCATIFSGAL